MKNILIIIILLIIILYLKKYMTNCRYNRPVKKSSLISKEDFISPNISTQSINLNKYIICYPLGGFCDMLNIINRCLEYAIKYNRILIIDATKEWWFQQDIYKYITFTHENIYNKLSYSNITNNMTVYPPEFKNLINKKFNISFISNEYYTDFKNKTETDLSIDYTEDVIIYGSASGGIAYTLLNYFYFNTIITDEYYNRLNKLPKKYISFHIRNTDYKSDVDGFLLKHHQKLINNSVFIGTDNITTRDEIKKKYGKNVYYFSDIPKVDGNNNIHYNHGNIDQTKFIIDCIVDILLLASADEFYYSSERSGYSKFALFLFENKNILNKILNK